MIVVGMDSGLASFGWVVAEYREWTGGEGVRPRFLRGGVLTTKPSKDVRKGVDSSNRARHLFFELREKLLIESVDCIAVESLAFPMGRVQWSVISGLGRARGLVDALAVVMRADLYEATPQELKKALTGVSSASKAEVEERLLMHHPEVGPLLDSVGKTKREHLADACAAVIACQRFNFQALTRRWFNRDARLTEAR